MLRIGIVGCGRILAAHLQGYRRLREAGVDDFRITALCARRAADAHSYLRRDGGHTQRPPVSSSPGDPLSVGDLYLSDFQEDVDVEVFTDYREMIARGPIDAVNDFTTHELHYPIAQAALTHGKHLLTQKPLAVSLAEARTMCELADSRGLALGVFENARNRPDTRQLAWLFRSGSYGTLQLVLMVNVGSWWAPDRIVAETPWRHQRAAGGGITLDIGVHLFHHLRHVAGEITRIAGRTLVLEPQRMTRDATGRVVQQVACDAEDTMLANFETERGVTGSLTASWGGRGAATLTGSGRGIVYYGTHGSVVGDQFTSLDGHTRPLAELYAREAPRAEQQQAFPLGLTDAFALNQYDWLEAIRQDRPPETSGREGFRDLAVALALHESSRLGRAVEIAEFLDGRFSQGENG